MRLGRWLPALLRSRAFFKPCQRASCAGGGGARSRGGGLVNLFCLECADENGACLGCAEAHLGHRVLQIRRSSYHEVVRLQEASKLVNTSSIQPYTINSARVVFLQERPQSRTGKSLQVGGGALRGRALGVRALRAGPPGRVPVLLAELQAGGPAPGGPGGARQGRGRRQDRARWPGGG